MELVETVKFKEVIDYDFMFVGGDKVAFAVEPAAGDSFEEQTDRFVINLVSKPSIIIPEEKSDPSTIEIFKSGIAAKVTTPRKVRLPSEEEVFNMRKTIKTILTEPPLPQ
jgi:hypothetical protein